MRKLILISMATFLPVASIGTVAIAALWLTTLLVPAPSLWRLASGRLIFVGPRGGCRISSGQLTSKYHLSVTAQELEVVVAVAKSSPHPSKDLDLMVGPFGFIAQSVGASRIRIITLPPWLVLMIFALFASYVVLRWVIRRCRTTNLPSSCIQCGYDLTGNASGVCPECGTAVVTLQVVNSCATNASITRSCPIV